MHHNLSKLNQGLVFFERKLPRLTDDATVLLHTFIYPTFVVSYDTNILYKVTNQSLKFEHIQWLI